VILVFTGSGSKIEQLIGINNDKMLALFDLDRGVGGW
jgi:hypothetical protein